MQKIKNLLGQIKNPKINQEIEGLLNEVSRLSLQVNADQKAISELEVVNQKLKNDLDLICQRLDETTSDLSYFIQKAEDTKSATIAITSWAIFFVAVASAVYVIVNNL